MKQLYGERIFEGVGFSKNGKRAYLRGEKPLFMWPEELRSPLYLMPTCPHHIERNVGGIWRRHLLMFYAEKVKGTE